MTDVGVIRDTISRRPLDTRVAFSEGRSVSHSLDGVSRAVDGTLSRLWEWLSELPVEDSFAWTADQHTRQSCWVVWRLDGRGFVRKPEALTAYDGDQEAGLRGLRLLQDSRGWGDDRLMSVTMPAWYQLSNAARVMGFSHDLISRMSIRFRFIAYTGGSPGIGAHFDGNLLSAVVTNRYGLTELGYDGTITRTSPRVMSIMPGSVAHRLTTWRHVADHVLPTFHLVPPTSGGESVGAKPKVSVAAFLNLPDREIIPEGTLGIGNDWYHDVGMVKADDGPEGSLSYLWESQAQALGISVADLAAGRLP